MRSLADLLAEEMIERPRLVSKLSLRCSVDRRPLYALNAAGVRTLRRLSFPTCLHCGREHSPLTGHGSRDFDGVDDIIDLGSPSILDDVNTFTTLVWISPDSAGETTGRVWAIESSSGSSGFKRMFIGSDAGNYFQGNVHCATTVAQSYTTNIFTWGNWYFIGMTFDSAGDKKIRLFKGTPATGVAECSYQQQQAGIGDVQSEAAVNKYLGNCGDTSRTFDGKMAHVLWFNRVLTTNEMEHIRAGGLLSNGLIGYWPLWGVASPEPDLSGNGNNGTVTGAVLANHPPIGRYAPKPRWGVPLPRGAEYINISDSGIGTDAVLSIQDWLTITDTGAGIEQAYVLGEVLIDGLRLDHALTIRVSEPTNIASKPVSVGLPFRIYLGKQGRTVEIEGWASTIAELNALSALADGAVHEIQLPTGSRISVHIPEVKPVRPVEPGKYPYTIRAVERMD